MDAKEDDPRELIWEISRRQFVTVGQDGSPMIRTLGARALAGPLIDALEAVLDHCFDIDPADLGIDVSITELRRLITTELTKEKP